MSYEADVADLTALKAIIANSLPDKARIRVLTLLQEFWLDKKSNADPDGITVITARFSRGRRTPGAVVANLGQGRWLRNPLPVPEWTAKTEWYQDTVCGNDENSGDKATPVKTMAEITRRLRRVDSALYTIHQQKAVAATDSVRFAPEISDKGAAFFPDTQTVARILIKGKRRTIPPAPPMVFAATSGTDPKTNTQATITDPSVSWSSQIGQIIRITTGTAKDAQAVVLKDLTAEAKGKARVSEWAFPATGLLSVLPAAGDSYEFVELPAFLAPILYAGLPSKIALEFEDISFEAPTAAVPVIPSLPVIPSACTTVFTSCKFTVPLPGPPTGFPFDCFLHACSVCFEKPTNFSQTSVGSGPRFVACGLVKALIQVSAFGRTNLTDTVIQGGAIRGIDLDKGRVFGGLIVVAGKLGIFDSPAASSTFPLPISAITLRRGMAMQIQKAASLYGSGNARFGVEVLEASSLAVQRDVARVTPGTTATSTISITGKLGDVRLDDIGTAIPQLVGGGKVPDAQPLSTWAHWADTSTFDRYVFSHRTGSRIINTL